ncbi:hypothetical protein EVAR_53289_1 [Eumeta japonica]|uniref:Uncharacterized protein n=1 Tax=Eumeta variegata TaxID=151549 RepID=A0A4C1YWE6_EUMVA|nr:hypothetical protein EVAR_53289_1 [Eumeta japonica]
MIVIDRRATAPFTSNLFIFVTPSSLTCQRTSSRGLAPNKHQLLRVIAPSRFAIGAKTWPGLGAGVVADVTRSPRCHWPARAGGCHAPAWRPFRESRDCYF